MRLNTQNKQVIKLYEAIRTADQLVAGGLQISNVPQNKKQAELPAKPVESVEKHQGSLYRTKTGGQTVFYQTHKAEALIISAL